LSTVSAESTYKENAFSLDDYSRARNYYYPEYAKEYENEVKRLGEILSDKNFVESNEFQIEFLHFLKTSNNYHLLIMLFTELFFYGHRNRNVNLLKECFSVLVERTKVAVKSERWNFLYMMEQLLCHICYDEKLDTFILEKIKELTPREALPPFTEEEKAIMKELYGSDGLDDIEKGWKKTLEYDANAYQQFTFILFAYIRFKETVP
jgi:hypothetical protein